MQQVFLVLALIIAIIAVSFAAQNSATTQINFLFWKAQTPLAVALLVSVGLGALISILLSVPGLVRNQLGGRKQKKFQADLEARLKAEQTRLTQAEQKLQEMEIVKAQLAEKQAQLAEQEQRLQILQGRLAIAEKNSATGRPLEPPPSA